MFYSTLLRLYCLWCLHLINHCQGRPLDVELQLKCTLIDPSSGNITKCFSKRITKTISETTLNVTLFKEVATIMIKVNFRRKSKDNYVEFYHQDIEFDGCSLIKNPRVSPIAHYMYEIFKKYSNLNHSCPYKDYILIDRCRIDINAFKWAPKLPGEYLIKSQWTVNGKRDYEFDVYLKVN